MSIIRTVNAILADGRLKCVLNAQRKIGSVNRIVREKYMLYNDRVYLKKRRGRGTDRGSY